MFMQRLEISHFNHPKCLGTLERKDYRDEQGANLPGVEKDLFEWLASACLCLRGIYMEENFDIVNISHQATYYRIQREAYG
jgi:hypothetical protein